jgi:hypothetical protein
MVETKENTLPELGFLTPKSRSETNSKIAHKINLAKVVSSASLSDPVAQLRVEGRNGVSTSLSF